MRKVLRCADCNVAIPAKRLRAAKLLGISAERCVMCQPSHDKPVVRIEGLAADERN